MAADNVLDIFNDDAFSLASLTDAINKMPYVPGRAGALGIFNEQGVNTLTVQIEEMAGELALVPTTPRGAPPSQTAVMNRTLRTLTVPHLPLADTIKADEVQGVRQFGTGSQLQGMQAVVDQRLQMMAQKLDATVEYGRIGAIKGVILDSDGATTIYNLFTEFGVGQQTEDVVLGTTTTDLIAKAAEIAGKIEDELGGGTYQRLHAFCGSTFWSRFVGHAAVKDAYRYYQATGQNQNPLREDLRYAGFQFGGITWEQYRGSVGGVAFVPVAEAFCFPVGVPNLFRTYFAPADYVETVNTIGLPRYAKQYPTDNRNSGVTVEAQSNPLSICTRPRVLIKITTSN